ncbi:MAG: phage virion morphogenesis protein [Bacteroidetes bacterium]|nr:phage virion morphogenesis protein [Bacteroidota bacterium]
MKQILKDLSVGLLDEFDRNFERKAFFDQPWPARRLNTRGSLLVVRGGGGLRGSLRAQINQNSITFSSHQRHAALHNEGGSIVVTERMKRFFWAMHYRFASRMRYRKDGKPGKKSLSLGEQAQYYQNLALMRTGSSINMPRRRFIGPHPQVDNIVRQVADQHMQGIQTMLKQLLKPR